MKNIWTPNKSIHIYTHFDPLLISNLFFLPIKYKKDIWSRFFFQHVHVFFYIINTKEKKRAIIILNIQSFHIFFLYTYKYKKDIQFQHPIDTHNEIYKHTFWSTIDAASSQRAKHIWFLLSGHPVEGKECFCGDGIEIDRPRW